MLLTIAGVIRLQERSERSTGRNKGKTDNEMLGGRSGRRRYCRMLSAVWVAIILTYICACGAYTAVLPHAVVL